MSKSILKARYTLTPIAGTDLVEIGILKKEFFRLTAKMTFWSILPSALFIAGMIVYGTYESPKKKTTHTEDHLPQDPA